ERNGALAVPTHPPHPRWETRGRGYLLGLGLGFAPVLMEWLAGAFTCPYTLGIRSAPCRDSTSASLQPFFLNGGLFLYAAIIAFMFTCFVARPLRFVAYGLLTMVLVAPIIAVLGCTAISGVAHPAPPG